MFAPTVIIILPFQGRKRGRVKMRVLSGVSGVIRMIRACAVISNKSLVTKDNPNLCPSIQFVLSVFYKLSE